MHIPVRKHKNIKTIALILGSVGIVALGLFFIQSRFNIFPQMMGSSDVPKQRIAFPQLSNKNLSVDQMKVLTILKTEYALNPAGTKYSQGVDEPWCADFVSWVFNEAGRPLTNPNSKSWRIPGTYTLREYYESTERFKPAKSEFVPKVGDIMLYDNPSPFGQHTNIVIRNEDGIITTIGGNEPGGIRIVKHDTPDRDGFIGYGIFEQ